jgi:hypothetical protein
MNAHRWSRIVAGFKRCKRCSVDIVAGASYRLVTKHDWPYCALCAKAILNEEPPENVELPVVTQVVTRTPEFARFDRPRVASTVREKILDARQRQLGEREPGEDDVA